MANNKRDKKLIGGIIGGATGIVGGLVSLLGKKKKSLPATANSLISTQFGANNKLDSGKTITEQDNRTDEEKRQKKIGFFGNINSVNGVLLPNGNVGVVTADSNNIIPIGGVGTEGTINQNQHIQFKVSDNLKGASIFVNGENTFKTTPSTLVYSLTDVLKDGIKTITLQKEGYISADVYVISTIQNPDFNETALDSYENKLVQQDSLLNIEPNPNKRIFTQTPAYVFKIEHYKNGQLQSTDGTLENNEIKNIEFDLNKQASSISTTTSEIPTNTLTINLTGPAQSVLLTKDVGVDYTRLTT
jgi:hypothetical protein